MQYKITIKILIIKLMLNKIYLEENIVHSQLHSY